MGERKAFEDCVIDAAIQFARDHGPVAAAVGGDERARLAVGAALARALTDEGLIVEFGDYVKEGQG